MHPESAARDPAEVMRSLREQALSVTATELGLLPTTTRPYVWGILMDTGYTEAVVTLVAFAEGTTSIYFSKGGGIIGVGEHATVRQAAAKFLEVAESYLNAFGPVTETPVPAVGRVRFYVRTFTRTVSAEASEDDLGYGRHQLSPLFHAGHAVITAAREVSERQQ